MTTENIFALSDVVLEGPDRYAMGVEREERKI